MDASLEYAPTGSSGVVIVAAACKATLLLIPPYAGSLEKEGGLGEDTEDRILGAKACVYVHSIISKRHASLATTVGGGILLYLV